NRSLCRATIALPMAATSVCGDAISVISAPACSLSLQSRTQKGRGRRRARDALVPCQRSLQGLERASRNVETCHRQCAWAAGLAWNTREILAARRADARGGSRARGSRAPSRVGEGPTSQRVASSPRARLLDPAVLV